MLRLGSSAEGNLSRAAISDEVALISNTSNVELNSPSQGSVGSYLNLETPSSSLSIDNLVVTDLQVSARCFTIDLTYTPRGARFGERGFFSTIIAMLVYAAVRDPKTAASGRVSAYNTEEGYTVSVTPTSTAARGNLPWERLIQVLGLLPSGMYGEQRGGKWAELQGRARFDGQYIGRIYIQRGDHRDGSGCSA